MYGLKKEYGRIDNEREILKRFMERCSFACCKSHNKSDIFFQTCYKITCFLSDIVQS